MGLFRLQDADSCRVFYTWSNNKRGGDATFEKLDRVMGNDEWFSIFPRAMVMNLPIIRLDHSPSILDTNWVQRHSVRLKRFEEFWLQHEDSSMIMRKVWDLKFNGSTTFKLVQKQKVLLRHLCNWSNLSIKWL